ncbi:N-acetylmuramoyl-L-alanine amidase, partial [Frigoriflavimonas asaccharolytica]
EYNSGYYQEIFAEIVFMHVSTKSSNIDVDLNAEQIKQVKGLSTTIVDKKPEEKKDGVCECQKYNLIWGSKVSCDFRKKVVKISEELWPDNYLKMANNLMAIFAWESGGTFKPDAPNQANSGGTGLIQFMPSTAKDLLGHEITMETVKNYYGKKYNKKTKQKEDWNLDRVKDFAEMTAIKQLDYVKKFFDSLKGKKLEFVDFYLKVLFPVSSGLPEHVVFADNVKKLDRPSETDKLKNKRVSSYSKNKGMDLNKDGKLMKSEIKISVQKYLTEGLPYSKIEKCENIIEKKSAAITGKCAEGKVVEEFIDNFLITKNKIDNCNKHAMTQDVKIIVLHRTAGGFASGTLNHMKSEGYGAHFVVDYDGTVYQTIGINKRGSHMGVAQFASTKTAGWGNNNSIAIETCGYSIDKDGNNRVGKKYDNIPHHHWEVVKNNQAKSVACLLKFLLNHFKLNIGDVKVHEKLCKKQPLEGQNVYDAMLPYYNNK